MTATPTATPTTTPTTILQAAALTKSYAGADGELPVLGGIDLEIREGEIVALLGKSGSGKSTLLRCLAGLIPASSGSVTYRGEELRGANPGTAMVFQTFALLPWLTVQQNVELGLEAKGMDREARARQAVEAIDLIGLDGFESAYPKELSGGMRQRVGFARALVVEPDVLMMDEPFSALDVLTAENLRGELMELWASDRFPAKAVVLVTHNIEEAVLMADRVVVLGSRPYGTIKETFAVDLARPRDRSGAEFERIVDAVYAVMTGRTAKSPAVAPPAKRTPANTPLPAASVDGMAGLAEIVLQRGTGDGSEDLADLADELGLEVDDVLPLVDGLELLGLAEVRDLHLVLTPRGTAFAGADVQESKELFAEGAMEVPLVHLIHTTLKRSRGGTQRAGFFRDLLSHHYTSEQLERQLETATDWGRYGELYGYHADAEEYRLDEDPTT
ncbi:nitrate/sulfonate/bicarbonate ABC transporter ATP-binding protein [Streptomyces sp. AP-93]|uniref:ABC transporter ATP-binding protein n=1 Tax=Streptomyces sp. AP-93 TaxID=2929048 RepID=UPI001FB00B9F|nr:nitrate/sulfonate/bicarbonate ABC transporter ATP-binding protein [Streptomyces sp. AP-93]MCJ0875814.1 nitrate/sulfonate/bicarbonate ABC transporter ATP-binding protein [Streptomyces sp. AP-93]